MGAAGWGWIPVLSILLLVWQVPRISLLLCYPFGLDDDHARTGRTNVTAFCVYAFRLPVCVHFCTLINTVSEVRSWSPRRDAKILGCLYSIPLSPSFYTSLRHQADNHNRSPSPCPPTLHHSRCAPPPHPTFPLHAAPHPHANCLPWCLQCHYPRS